MLIKFYSTHPDTYTHQTLYKINSNDTLKNFICLKIFSRCSNINGSFD